MSDQQQESMREVAFTAIDQFDQAIQPVIDQLAKLIDQLPDNASLAPDKAHYLVMLLKRIDDIDQDLRSDSNLR